LIYDGVPDPPPDDEDSAWAQELSRARATQGVLFARPPATSWARTDSPANSTALTATVNPFIHSSMLAGDYVVDEDAVVHCQRTTN